MRLLGEAPPYSRRGRRGRLRLALDHRAAALARAGAHPVHPERRDRAQQKAQADLRAELSEPERLLFDQVRSWRADTANRAGVPAYLMLTNREVVRLIAKRPASVTALTQI